MRSYIIPFLYTLALVALFFMDASATGSLCVSRLLGFGSCPGCGLGHAIHHTLHLRFAEGLHHHIMGIPATIGIFYMIVRPFISKHTPYEPATSDDAGPAGQ